MTQFTVKQEKTIYSVSQLNRETRLLLEQHYPHVWVTGELSNLARPSSGHIYFTLKDSSAQIRCAMFRNRNHGVSFKPENGMQVTVLANLSIYEGRGDYQLIVNSMEEAGSGALKRQFEMLKKKLAGLGWFDEKHKKTLPSLPSTIGIVTSASGAAVRDVLTTLRRRFPAINVIIYPTQVQGPQAAPLIAAQINIANQRKECDVIIVTRGGGSLEDLWAFNEEIVAKAIFESDLPIISAIGHEIDFTIADFVADSRAATPTAAAELVSPDATEWLQRFQHHFDRIRALIQSLLKQTATDLQHISKRLRHPGQLIIQQMQRIDELDTRLQSTIKSVLRHKLVTYLQTHHRLMDNSPSDAISRVQLQTQHISDRMTHLIQQQLDKHQLALQHAVTSLNQLNPLATLERGYTIVKKDHKVAHRLSDLTIKDKVKVQFHDGIAECDVTEIVPDES